MRRVRNSIFEKVLYAVLSIAEFCVISFKARTSNEQAIYLRTITENIDREMAAEAASRARPQLSDDESEGEPQVT